MTKLDCRKCDRCDNDYLHEKEPELKIIINKNNTKDNYFASFIFYFDCNGENQDLCPACVDSLQTWWNR